MLRQFKIQGIPVIGSCSSSVGSIPSRRHSPSRSLSGRGISSRSRPNWGRAQLWPRLNPFLRLPTSYLKLKLWLQEGRIFEQQKYSYDVAEAPFHNEYL